MVVNNVGKVSSIQACSMVTDTDNVSALSSQLSSSEWEVLVPISFFFLLRLCPVSRMSVHVTSYFRCICPDLIHSSQLRQNVTRVLFSCWDCKQQLIKGKHWWLLLERSTPLIGRTLCTTIHPTQPHLHCTFLLCTCENGSFSAV